MMTLANTKSIVLTALLACLAPFLAQAEGLIADQAFIGKNQITASFSAPIAKDVAEDIKNYTVFEESDPDILLELSSANLASDGKSVTLTFKAPLNTVKTHVVEAKANRTWATFSAFLFRRCSSTTSFSPSISASASSLAPQRKRALPRAWAWFSLWSWWPRR
jgi:hypothetical protein